MIPAQPGGGASTTPSSDLEAIARAPKVLLHDHLDGGVRPETVCEIADAIGHRLPAGDPQALAAWFVEACSSGSLERYLETFTHTVAIMQTADHLRRVARQQTAGVSRVDESGRKGSSAAWQECHSELAEKSASGPDVFA